MKRKMLYVVRHANAEGYGMGKSDFERDLTAKGIDRAKHIAEQLEHKIDHNIANILVLASPAHRAAQTAKIFCTALGHPEGHIQWIPDFYEAHQLFLLKRVNDTPSAYNTVLLFGHNPSVSDFIAYISNHTVHLDTAEVACLQLEEHMDYTMLSANTATLQEIITG